MDAGFLVPSNNKKAQDEQYNYDVGKLFKFATAALIAQLFPG